MLLFVCNWFFGREFFQGFDFYMWKKWGNVIKSIDMYQYVFYSYTNRVELDEEVVEEMNRGMCFISQGWQSYFPWDYMDNSITVLDY